jgi:tetratricopeptide (TPR) repeat protein
MHPPDTRLDPQDASAAIRQLVDLGYIEEPNADRRRGMEEITQELRYNLAQAYMGAGRFADALAIMEELWQARPAESRFGLQVLLCRIALKDAAGARTTYRQLVKARREDSLHARKELKALLQAKKDAGQHAKDWSEQERRQIRRVRARTRTDRTSLAFHEAQIRFVEGRYEEALQKFEKLEAHASPDRRVSLYVRMAECNLLLGRHAEAEKHFHQALDLDAECAPAHLGLTRCLLAQQRGLEAAAAALNARDLDSGNPRAHFFYGEAMAATRHFQWAADAYHEALRLHPSFTEAHLRLAALYETRLKHPERARKHRQQATAAEKRIQSIPGNVLHPVDTVRSKFNAKAKTEPLPPFNRTGRVDVPPAQWIIVVTGLPRSGTSMLMQMLQAGGIPVFADEKRRSDVSNERGYYEYERVKQLARESDWLAGARGHAIKIVIPLMRYFPLQLHAKVLVVEREMAAVLASQAKMLERQQQSAQPVQHGGLERIYRTYQRQTGAFLRRHPRIDGLTLRYDEILAEPATAAAAVAAFLDIPDLDAGKMARAVQPGLRHEYARS